MLNSRDLTNRPAKVTLAVKLFYAIVVIGVSRAVMTIIRHLDVRSPDFLILTKLAVYTFSILLIYQLGQGRNWARWALLLLLVGCIPLVILPAFNAFSHNLVDAGLTFIQTALFVIALICVFHKDTAEWFAAEKGA